MNKKILIAYFSCSGVTKSVAKTLAKAINADLYEIAPKQPYMSADLNWMDKSSRSSVEMRDSSSRPEIAGRVENMQSYDAVFLGFPIWWYVAPTIINTFLESYDFSGKTIIPFATSGGSGLGKTLSILRPLCSDTAVWKEGKVLNGNPSVGELSKWVESLNI